MNRKEATNFDMREKEGKNEKTKIIFGNGFIGISFRFFWNRSSRHA